MANICWFKGIVKGKKINCEKFLDVFPCSEILDSKVEGTEANYSILFCGECPGCICGYASNKANVKKINDTDLLKISNDNINEYTKYRLSDFAILFNIDVRIFEMYEDGYDTNYYHYNVETKVDDEIPIELVISKNEVKKDNGLNIKPLKIKNIDENGKCTDKEELLKLIKKSGYYLSCASDNLKKDKDVILEAVKSKGELLNYASDDLKNDLDVVKNAVKNNYDALQYASDEMKNNKEIRKYAIINNFDLYDSAPEEIKNDISLIRQILSKDYSGKMTEKIISKRNNDKKFAIDCLSCNGRVFEYLSDELKDDKDVVLNAIKKGGYLLQYASERLRDDKEIVMKSLINSHGPLRYASDRLRDDKEVVIAALNSKDWYHLDAIEYASERLRDDKEIIMMAIEGSSGYLIQYASDRLKNDKEVIMKAIDHCPEASEYLPEKMLDDKQVVLKIVKQYGIYLQYASERLKNDKTVVTEAIKSPGYAICFASKELREDEELQKIALKDITKELSFDNRDQRKTVGGCKEILLADLKINNGIIWDNLFERDYIDKTILDDKDIKKELEKYKK